MSEYEMDTPPPVARPEKNICVFITDESIGVFPDRIYDGKMGPLPLLMSVNVGYDPEDCDPYMHHYESQEILFAYKKGAQKRVLMRDSHGRTLSLPLHSTLPFRLGTDTKETTMAQIVSSHRLPVSAVHFARAECMDFTVHKRAANHHYFGSFTVTMQYDEPYLWCLAVQPNGQTGDKPIVLPRNLKELGFCPVVGVYGAADPAAKVQEFVRSYSQIARQLPFTGDPFFQELAIVSHGPDPVTKVQPYIDQTTFVPIRLTGRPAPLAPSREPPPPPPPSRNPLHPQSSAEEKEEKDQGQGSNYCSVSDQECEEHIYTEPRESGHFKPTTTNVVKPSQKPRTSAEVGGGEFPPLPDRSSQGRPLMKAPLPRKTFPEDPAHERPRLPEPRNPAPKPGSRGHPQEPHVDLMSPPKTHPLVVQSHLSSFSVEDVALKLKELGLEKYAKKFRKNRIDGVLLQKLREEDLKAEFNMSHMEFLLLDTFIHEGHIPQIAKSAPSSIAQKLMNRF